MGLLDALKQYVSDSMPGGLLNPEFNSTNGQKLAAELQRGLLESTGMNARDKRRAWNKNQLDAVSGSSDTRGSLDKQAYETAMNMAGMAPMGVLSGDSLKAELLRQAKEGWGKAIGDSGTFTLKKMYPVTIDINGNKLNFGASKSSGDGPLSLTRLVDTKLGPKFVHYKLSKDGDLIETGGQNLFAMSPDIRDEHIAHFNGMFGD